MTAAFTKIVQCLNRIGDELYIEAYPSKARSVVAMIHCHAPFFEAYEVQQLPTHPHATNGFHHGTASTFHVDEDNTPHCRIQIKALLSMFRTSSTVDKNVEQVELILEHGQLGQPECRLNVRLYCRHGVVMARHLFYEVGEPLRAIYNRQSCRHHWRVSSKILGDWMTYFQPRLGELTTVCTPTGTKLRSYDESHQTQQFQGVQAALRTELSVDITEFERYHVEAPVELTFSLKEFKVIVQLAEHLATPLSAYFEQEGSPMLLCIAHHELIAADFIVSTVTELGPSIAQLSSQASISEADPSELSMLRSATPSTVARQRSILTEHVQQPALTALSATTLEVQHSFLRPSYPGVHPTEYHHDDAQDDDSVCEDSDEEHGVLDEEYESMRPRPPSHPTQASTSSSNKKARLLF
ncbi:Rad9-domain-containing protein [Syncephalis pseudoplumigaleata]|uniref:Rad9-domain-containing protein n=1 Tax=Syncephalis pseudoplumigaleata TaxID=1712513 RepID=A0A4P9Z591_9FUNG|nr:Rad9-domain-containing protein [Syncephalis pseudoplumigaleata]|eukprot:RKP27773.1 Rad9-domain-containing protein [Syncephalis pseudoplumigaleata]